MEHPSPSLREGLIDCINERRLLGMISLANRGALLRKKS